MLPGRCPWREIKICKLIKIIIVFLIFPIGELVSKIEFCRANVGSRIIKRFLCHKRKIRIVVYQLSVRLKQSCEN